MTPTEFPELDLPDKWRSEYRGLRADGVGVDEALVEIAKRYGVSRSSVAYYVWPGHKERQNSRAANTWQYRISRRSFSRDAYRLDKRRRNRARRNMAGILELALAKVDYAGQNLRDLAELVEEICGIRFRPKTLLTLSRQYGERHGRPLLQRENSDEARYTLADRPR